MAAEGIEGGAVTIKAAGIVKYYDDACTGTYPPYMGMETAAPVPAAGPSVGDVGVVDIAFVDGGFGGPL